MSYQEGTVEDKKGSRENTLRSVYHNPGNMMMSRTRRVAAEVVTSGEIQKVEPKQSADEECERGRFLVLTDIWVNAYCGPGPVLAVPSFHLIHLISCKVVIIRPCLKGHEDFKTCLTSGNTDIN